MDGGILDCVKHDIPTKLLDVLVAEMRGEVWEKHFRCFCGHVDAIKMRLTTGSQATVVPMDFREACATLAMGRHLCVVGEDLTE